MDSNIILPWDSKFDEFLRDESRSAGNADSISFPASEEEVIEIVKEVGAQGKAITVQGARTGIVAGAVPQGGHVMNLSRMKSIGEIVQYSEANGEYRINVQPGVLLSELREIVGKEGLFFPPDPTEASASIGGMAASNASGAMSFYYGPTRCWIDSLRVVLSDGDVLSLKRGENFANKRAFSINTENGRIISGNLPSYRLPDVKSVAGYYVDDNMDLIDLFIGMEGTLGIITETGLRLIPAPNAINGLTIFLPSEEAAIRFVRAMRNEDESVGPVGTNPVAIEFFNCDSLNLLRKMKAEYSAFEGIPALKPHFHNAIYLEFHGNSDEELEEVVMNVMEAVYQLGGNDDDTWYATNVRELEPLKAFRHATPEAVNLLIDKRRRNCPELTKLGTDMSVPNQHLEKVISMYNMGLKENGLESVIFGHIGNNHVHVNILPRNMDEYEKGKALYMQWARNIVSLGGSVSAEHGIGKLKVQFLKLMYSEDDIRQMKELRSLFDPAGLLNPGNLF